jgi:hypothetical protein
MFLIAMYLKAILFLEVPFTFIVKAHRPLKAAV